MDALQPTQTRCRPGARPSGLTRRSLACALAVVLGASGCGGGSAAVVAKVGQDTISNASLDHWVAVDTVVEGAARVGQARGRALGLLVSWHWLIGEAGELGVRVSDAEAKKRLELFSYERLAGTGFETLPREAELRGFLLDRKVSHSDKLWLTKLAILTGRVERARLERARHAIAPAQVAKYYREHMREFALPERRDLEVLGHNDLAVVKKAKREIESGASFVELAKRISVDGEAPEGLQLGLARGEEEPEYDKVVFPAKPGVLLGPIKQDFYYLFKVIRVKPARLQTLAEADGAIRRKLADEQAPTVADLERKWVARTACRRGYVMPKCGPHSLP
jgi:hypothetical protein